MSRLLAGVRAALSWLVFPTLLMAVVTATLALSRRGLPPPLVAVAVLFVTAAVLLVLERIVPLHRAWNRAPDRLDLVLLLGNRGVDLAVVAASLALLGALPVHLHWWPTAAPLPLQALLGIAVGELVRYAFHVASHRPGVLARVHTTHHQPERMYTLNGPRLHPLNQLWLAVANTLPMLLLGADREAVLLAVDVTVFLVLFQHANVRLRFDGWNLIFATPDVHRLHHLRAAGRGVNYGIALLVWDVIFGSYQAARREAGVDEIGFRW